VPSKKGHCVGALGLKCLDGKGSDSVRSGCLVVRL